SRIGRFRTGPPNLDQSCLPVPIGRSTRRIDRGWSSPRSHEWSVRGYSWLFLCVGRIIQRFAQTSAHRIVCGSDQRFEVCQAPTAVLTLQAREATRGFDSDRYGSLMIAFNVARLIHRKVWTRSAMVGSNEMQHEFLRLLFEILKLRQSQYINE